jgi:hypothetical protein
MGAGYHKLHFSAKGPRPEFGPRGAPVIKADIGTANAVIHVIDTVTLHSLSPRTACSVGPQGRDTTRSLEKRPKPRLLARILHRPQRPARNALLPQGFAAEVSARCCRTLSLDRLGTFLVAIRRDRELVERLKAALRRAERRALSPSTSSGQASPGAPALNLSKGRSPKGTYFTRECEICGPGAWPDRSAGGARRIVHIDAATNNECRVASLGVHSGQWSRYVRNVHSRWSNC